MAVKEENIRFDNSLKLIVKTSLFVLIGLFLSKVLTYIYRIVIARNYGPDTYGLFSLGLTIFLMFVSISSLGLIEGVLRFVPHYLGKNKKNEVNYIIKFSFFSLLISSVLAGLLMFLFSTYLAISVFHNVDLIIYLKIFSFAIPFAVLGNLFLSILRANEKIKEFSFVQNILQNLVKLVFIGLFIILGIKSGEAVAMSYLMGMIFLFIAAYLFFRKISSSILILKNFKNNKIRSELVSYSWPLILLGVISNLMYWIDSLSLGYFKDAYAVGLYNAVVPLAMLFLIPTEAVMQLFFPLINKEYSNNRLNLVEQLSKQVSKWIFIINLPAFLLIIIFPGAFINLFFGSQYIVAENALRILALGSFTISFMNTGGYLISMLKRSKIILFNTLTFSLLNLILNCFLVPRYGINGAALATTICSIGLVGSLFFIVKNLTGIIFLRRKMINIALVSIIPIILLIFIKSYLEINKFTIILLTILFFIFYGLLIYLTKCLDKNDLFILDKLKNKFFS
jgi:O-antigen/teichoic acid export membrane protein